METKHVIKCLRRQLAWYKHTNTHSDALDNQFSVAIADEDGYPHKASKNTWTDKLTTRYKSADPPVFTYCLPLFPQVVIIDVMFIINTRPLRQTKTILDYTKLLFNQFILPHYKANFNEVHLIFDKPGRQQFNPKHFEQRKRSYSIQQKVSVNITYSHPN